MVQPQYQSGLHTKYHADLFATRNQLSYAEYESFYKFAYNEDGGEQDIPVFNTGYFRLHKLQNHKRLYENVMQASQPVLKALLFT